MESTFELVAVAFMRSVGGAVRILLAIDRDGEQLFDGEPALLVEHRPGRPSEQLEVDGADRIPAEAFTMVHSLHRGLAALVEAAFDETGAFDGQRVLGLSVTLRAARDSFDE